MDWQSDQLRGKLALVAKQQVPVLPLNSQSGSESGSLSTVGTSEIESLRMMNAELDRWEPLCLCGWTRSASAQRTAAVRLGTPFSPSFLCLPRWLPCRRWRCFPPAFAGPSAAEVPPEEKRACLFVRSAQVKTSRSMALSTFTTWGSCFRLATTTDGCYCHCHAGCLVREVAARLVLFGVGGDHVYVVMCHVGNVRAFRREGQVFHS